MKNRLIPISVILIILFILAGCSDSILNSMLTPDDVDRYITHADDGQVCLESGIETVCLTLIPKNTDKNINAPIIHVHPQKLVYIFYYEGKPILRAERATDTTNIRKAFDYPTQILDDSPPSDDTSDNGNDDSTADPPVVPTDNNPPVNTMPPKDDPPKQDPPPLVPTDNNPPVNTMPPKDDPPKQDPPPLVPTDNNPPVNTMPPKDDPPKQDPPPLVPTDNNPPVNTMPPKDDPPKQDPPPLVPTDNNPPVVDDTPPPVNTQPPVVTQQPPPSNPVSPPQTPPQTNNVGEIDAHHVYNDGWIIWINYDAPPEAYTLEGSGLTITINDKQITSADIQGFARVEPPLGVQFFYPTGETDTSSLTIEVTGLVSASETVTFEMGLPVKTSPEGVTYQTNPL